MGGHVGKWLLFFLVTLKWRWNAALVSFLFFWWGLYFLYLFISSVFSYLWGHAELKGREGRGTKKGDGRFLVRGERWIHITSTFLFIDSVHVNGGPREKVSVSSAVYKPSLSSKGMRVGSYLCV